LITCDIIPGRLKSCSVPFFDLNVELLMRTYIAVHDLIRVGVAPSDSATKRAAGRTVEAGWVAVFVANESMRVVTLADGRVVGTGRGSNTQAARD